MSFRNEPCRASGRAASAPSMDGAEGGRDPFGRFEASLGKVGIEGRRMFYAENFLHLMQIAP